MDWIFCIKLNVIYVALGILKSCAGEAGCPSSLPHTTLMTSYDGNCYQYVSDEKTWKNARDYCWQYGGSLVILSDEDTNRFVTEQLSSISAWSNSGVWIGLNDNADSDYWRWVTADKDVSIDMTWSNWGGNHPTQGFMSNFEGDCVRMKRSEGWQWHEASCYSLHRFYRFICQYEPDIVTTAVPDSLVAAIVRGQPKLVYHVYSTNTDDVTTEQADIGAQEAETLAAERALKSYLMYTVITGLALLLLILITLFAVYIMRRRSNKHKNHAPPSYEESIYEDIALSGPHTPLTKSDVTPTQTTSMQTSLMQESRMSNIYVEPDMQTSKIDDFNDVCAQQIDFVNQQFDTDGYMEPKKLMTHSQLSDTYLTVTPLGSPTGVKLLPVHSNTQVPQCMEFHDYANTGVPASRKLPRLPDDYLPMRGSREVLVCDENSKSVPSPTSSKEETIEQIYSVI